VLARAEFRAIACALFARAGDRLALHVRGHATPARALHSHVVALGRAVRHGGFLIVNDRIDVALAAGADGVHLGRRSLPLREARALVGTRWLGYSAHDVAEAVRANADGADYVILGTTYPSVSHPGIALGIDAVRAAAARLAVPLVAIGGVVPELVAEVMGAGAGGVAVLGGVWNAEDPVARAGEYLAALAAARAEPE
jgi:thiamine-phosphate diphosphorylase